MWQELMQFFTGKNEGLEDVRETSELIHDKFARLNLRKDHQQVIDQPQHTEQEMEPHGVSTKEMIGYWKDRFHDESNTVFAAPESYVQQTLNTSEAIMQPGAVEQFQLVRQHPLDELNAKLARTGEHPLPKQFLKKTGTHNRIVA